MDELPPLAQTLSELLGFEHVEWREGFVRIACTLRQHHMNRGGILHGGVLLTLLDDVGAAAGLWSPDKSRPTSVTVSLTGQFTGRAQSGRIIATGTMVGGGRTIYFARSEVADEAGQLLAYGSSTHRRHSAKAA